MTNKIIKKEEFRWSFMKKGTQVLNICTRMLLLYGFAAALMTATEAQANPTGGTVVGGSATITTTPAELQINQASQNAIINWNSFNIAAGETTHFYQPNASATALNRVFNSSQISAINGNLLANGRVVIINPNGVLIGKTGNVNTSGFIATSANISNSNFLSSTGTLNFDGAGNSNASVVNQGTITVGDEGLVALVAPTVRNDGVIQGNLSKIQLGAADTFGVDLYGDGLISLSVGSGTDKRTLTAENNGSIIATGGTVLMTAAAASDVVDSVINTAGVIQAQSITNHKGEIVLNGPGAKTAVSGTLDATGGSVETSGDYVNVANTAVVKAKDWTIDPLSIKIFNWTLDPGEFDAHYSNVSAEAIDLALSFGVNQVITTSGAAIGSQNNHGDIIVADDLVKIGGGNATLTLNATGDISFKNGADIYSTHNALNVALNAGGSITNNANNTITTNGGVFTANAGSAVNLAGNVSTGAGAITITGSTGSSAGDVATAGLITTSGAINVSTDQGTVTLNNGATSASGNITASGSGDLIASSAITTGGAGTVTLTSTGNNVTTQAISAANGAVTIKANRAVSTQDISTTNGGIKVSNGGTSGITTGNLSIISANGAAGMVDVDANGNLLTGNVTVIDNDVTGTSNESVSLTSGTAGGAATLTTGNISVISTDGNTSSLVMTAKGGALTVNGNVLVSNTDGGDPTLYSAAVVTLKAKGDLTINGANGITVASLDANQPNVGTTTNLSLTSTQGGINVAGAVTASSTETKTTLASEGADQIALSTLTLQAKNDIVVGGTISGTATSTNTDSTIQDRSTSLVSVVSTDGDLWLGNETVKAVATAATDQHTYDGTAYNYPGVPVAQIAGAHSATLILSGANNLYGLTITANDASKTYGQTVTFAPTAFTDSGLTHGGTITGVSEASTGAPATANAGIYAIDASNATGTYLYNYNISYVSGTLTVDKANLTVTADGKTKVYGTNDPALTFSQTGLVNGDTFTLTRDQYGTLAGENVGSYNIAIGSFAAGSNYNINYTGSALAITPASLTIAADSKTITQGQAVPAGTVGYTGFVNTVVDGVTISDGVGSLTTAPTVTSAQSGTPAAGNYTVGGAVASNYAITYVAGNLIVGNSAVNTNFLAAGTQFDELGRPIISVGDHVLNYYPPFEPRQTKTLDVDVSIKGPNPQIGTSLADIEPAAGGDDDKKGHKRHHKKVVGSVKDLANIEPAAGGNNAPARGTSGNFACADAFLDGKNCTAQ